MTSDASSSGPGSWPGQSGSGGAEPQGQWSQQPAPGWGQQPSAPQPSSQWGQRPQQPTPGQPGSAWGQPSQPQQGWGQAPQPPQPGSQWGQPSQPSQPQQGWGQAPQPQQPGSQWGQQPQQPGSQWGQQPQQPQQPGSQWGQQPQQPTQWGQQQAQGQPGWGQQAWGQQGSPWAPTLPGNWDAADPWASDSHPVDVRFTPEGGIGRYWGIPVIGHAVRLLCLVPHILVLVLVALVASVAMLFTWIPVLVSGHQARWAYALVGGLLRWSVRVSAWGWLLSGTYPPFSGGESDGQHVRVRIDEDQRINRLWGIPIIGWTVRVLLCIPHLIVLWVLGIVAGILLWFTWIPVLISGRQADLIYTLVGGYLRYSTRVSAYLMLLSGPYPPFRLD